MALDGIGGVGTMNVVSTVKPQQPKQTTDIHVEPTANSTSSNQLQVETRPVVSKDDAKKQDSKGFKKDARTRIRYRRTKTGIITSRLMVRALGMFHISRVRSRSFSFMGIPPGLIWLPGGL